MGYLTEQHRSLEGTVGRRITAPYPVEANTLRRFVHAAMESDPVHWDANVARSRGFANLPAPPLYLLHVLFQRPPGAPDPLDRLADDPAWDGTADLGDAGGLPPVEVPLKRLLNGGTEAELFALPEVGDVISAQARYASITEREGRSGPMILVTVETEYTNQAEALLARVRSTVIHR